MFPSILSFKRKYEEKMQKFPYDKYLQPMQIKVKLKRILIFKLEENNNSNKKNNNNNNNKNKDNNIARKKKKRKKLTCCVTFHNSEWKIHRPYKAPAASEEKLRGRSEMLRFMAAIQFNLR